MRNIRTAFWVSIVLMVSPSAALAAVCSIDIHPRFNLYVINVDGRPFKNKHYVDYGDAALLQKVLVEAGRCVPVQKVAQCGSTGSLGRTKIVLRTGTATASNSTRGSDAAQGGWSSRACERP